MFYSIKNSFLCVSVNSRGAELWDVRTAGDAPVPQAGGLLAPPGPGLLPLVRESGRRLVFGGRPPL